MVFNFILERYYLTPMKPLFISKSGANNAVKFITRVGLDLE